MDEEPVRHRPLDARDAAADAEQRLQAPPRADPEAEIDHDEVGIAGEIDRFPVGPRLLTVPSTRLRRIRPHGTTSMFTPSS